jgi:hypothetical protein
VKGDMNGNPVPLNGDGLLLLLLALVFVVAFVRYLLRAARERQVPYTPEYNAEFRRHERSGEPRHPLPPPPPSATERMKRWTRPPTTDTRAAS